MQEYFFPHLRSTIPFQAILLLKAIPLIKNTLNNVNKFDVCVLIEQKKVASIFQFMISF